MSGHSHWSKVKFKKGITDAQRGKSFSKIIRLIAIAARDGGDPNKNSKLRMALEKAKSINMPSNNIERALKRATGEEGEKNLQEVMFEAYGPGNIAVIIEGITDNKNRAIAEIKHILNENNGKLVGEGAVKWLFSQKGVIIINLEEQEEKFKNKEELELKIIDLGVEDLVWRESILEIYTDQKDLPEVKGKLIEQGIKIDSTDLDWVARERISVSDKEKEAAEKLFSSLDENDAIQGVYSNLKD